MRRSESAPAGHETCFDSLFNGGKAQPCSACLTAYERVAAELGPPPRPFLAWVREGMAKEGWFRRHVRYVADGFLGR